jgi:hypothetical protein
MFTKDQTRALAMWSVGAALGGVVAWKYVGGFWATLGGLILGGMAGGGVGNLVFAPTASSMPSSSTSSTPITAATLADATNDYGDRTSDPFAGLDGYGV